MALVQLQSSLQLVTIECFKCGVLFAVSAELDRNWHKTQDSFFCPNGHSQAYVESTAKKLQRELQAQAAKLAEKERALAWEKERVASLDKQLARERKATMRLKKRVSVGVCPCCQRTVQQLARHMQSKHPEFVAAQIQK